MKRFDLHIHTIYSSHAVYMRNKKVLRRLKNFYSANAFFEGKLWWFSFFFIDGIHTPEQVLKLAKKRNLDGIAITDHNTLLGSLEAQRLSKKYDILVIPGMEISTKEGEILAYGIREKIPMHLSAGKTIELIHRQNGVAIASHPFAPKHKNSDFSRLDEELIRILNFDGLEVFSPFTGKNNYWSKVK